MIDGAVETRRKSRLCPPEVFEVGDLTHEEDATPLISMLSIVRQYANSHSPNHGLWQIPQ